MEKQNIDNTVEKQQSVVENDQFPSNRKEGVDATSKSSKKLIIIGIVVGIIFLSAIITGVLFLNSNLFLGVSSPQLAAMSF